MPALNRRLAAGESAIDSLRKENESLKLAAAAVTPPSDVANLQAENRRLSIEASAIPDLKRQLGVKQTSLSSIQVENESLQTKLGTIREVVRTLVDLKGGKIQRLEELQPTDPSYPALLTEIRKDLQDLDQQMRRAVPQ